MRRLILSISAFSLLGMPIGCVHTAGECDCEGVHKAAVPVMPAVKPEPIKELPKEAPPPKEKEAAAADSNEPPPAP